MRRHHWCYARLRTSPSSWVQKFISTVVYEDTGDYLLLIISSVLYSNVKYGNWVPNNIIVKKVVRGAFLRFRSIVFLFILNIPGVHREYCSPSLASCTHKTKSYIPPIFAYRVTYRVPFVLHLLCIYILHSIIYSWNRWPSSWSIFSSGKQVSTLFFISHIYLQFFENSYS